MIEQAPHIWVPKRSPLWYPGRHYVGGVQLPVTLDDVAGKPLEPREYAALLTEIREATKIGRGVKVGRGVKLGRASSSSAPFTPLDIAGCVAWVDMLDSVTGYTLNSGNVSAMANKASAGSWTQGTAGNQDPFEATGLNSLPTWHGSGTNSHDLKSSESAVYTALAGSLQYTLFAVGSFDTLDRSDAFFGVGNTGIATSSTRYWGQSTAGNGRRTSQAVTDAGSAINANSSADTDTSPHVFEWWSPSTTTVSCSRDGAAADPSDTAQDPGTLTLNNSAIGSRPDSSEDFELDGRLSELLIYNSGLSSGNRSTVRQYMGARWSITVTP